MKHGDKAKAKSAKAKASGKEASSKKSVAKSSKGAEKSSSKAVQAVKAKPEKSSPAPKDGNGKGSKGARPLPAAGGFTNPVIAEAFKRAVKKYPTAFRRLTD